MTSTSSSTDAKGKGKALEDILPEPLTLSASSASTSPMVYDVFLNHRGCDVKEGLATDIYHELDRLRLRVFLDKQALQHGDSITEEIEVALHSASVCIAIFSPKYAESTWCLEELSFMVKNKKKIIPVFYNVEPSDLRWVAQGKGVYAEAFSQHKKKRRYTLEKLEEWQKILYEVSFVYGHELKQDKAGLLKSIINCVKSVLEALYNMSFLNGHELKNEEDIGRGLKGIVESVLQYSPFVPLKIAQHPVGLDEIVEDFENKSSDRELHGGIVGIVGMGGSGKTTLAKELYNRKCLDIGRYSFISEVRDAAAKNTLHNKQEKLLRDLLFGKFDERIDNIEEGKGILRARLRSLRVLIVLDDVDDVDHIDALLPEKSIFAAGSLIIVTTRELDVLRSNNISCIYRMKALDPFFAKKLFCLHALSQSEPVQEFDDLVKQAMNACQGLPLSLKVLGAQLYGRSKEYWVSQLHKISRILPHDIMKRLRISFDALDKDEKEMFLDTGCFFLGEEKSLAIEVWNGSGSGRSGLCGWETLLCKCLVELDEKNHIRMHDHLRDMGRQIAMERPPFRLFPSADLDIWRQTQAQERMLIRGIMETSTPPDHWRLYGLRDRQCPPLPLFKDYVDLTPSICGVQLLVGANNEFSEEYSTLLKELRWLRLFDFQKHSCLPPWLSLENLRVLELYGSLYLKELWQDDVQQPPLQLRQLTIRLGWNNCFQRFPRSIGRLQHLKKLSCSGGGSLQNLPEEFCNLQSLEHLDLRYLIGLLSLPSRFGDLTNLRYLHLQDCSKLKMLPDSFKQLKHLQYLTLRGCFNLTFTEHNADIMENTTKLEYLNFEGCKGLQVLPHHITKQAFLREVDLRRTSLTELPNSIGQLERLEVLRIGSRELDSLPDSLGNLSRLTNLTINCEKVRSLPESLGRLACLKSINIEKTNVEYLPKAFGHLTSLKTLSIDNSPIRELNFEFEEESSSLPRLEKIILGHCKRLKDITGIGSLRNLQYLILDKCPELADLPNFAELASIKEIRITGCQISGKMEGLEQLTSLETLEVESQWEVPGITSLEHAQRLSNLQLSAENIGAVEGCIKTLQTWPSRVMIWGRALGGVESVVKAFTSSNLLVVEACDVEADDLDEEADVDDRDDGAEERQRNEEADGDEEDDGDKEADEDGCRLKYRKTYLKYKKTYHNKLGWTLRNPKTCSSHEATVVCFVINCLSPQDALAQLGVEETNYVVNMFSPAKLREGKWVWIVAFSRGEYDEGGWRMTLSGNCRVEKGLIGKGEKGEVKDVFLRVLDALKM